MGRKGSSKAVRPYLFPRNFRFSDDFKFQIQIFYDPEKTKTLFLRIESIIIRTIQFNSIYRPPYTMKLSLGTEELSVKAIIYRE